MSVNSTEPSFSLPSVLMPLVSPYLNYEEACDCMRLNSSFYNYIDNNWKDMPKKVISIQLCYLPEKTLTLLFAECSKEERNGVIEYCQPGNSVKPITVRFGFGMSIDNSPPIPQFFDEYLKKQCGKPSLYHSKRKYYCWGNLKNLKLVLDGLVQRFSIGHIGVKMSVFNDQDELRVISDCLASHYKPTDGRNTTLLEKMHYCSLLEKFAASLGTDTCYINLREQHIRKDLLALDTSSWRYSMKNGTQLFDNNIVIPLINDWLNGDRQISAVTIQSDTKMDASRIAWAESFEELSKTMKGTKLEAVDDKHSSHILRSFQLGRGDGKIIRVVCGLSNDTSTDSFLFIHEHEPNCQLCCCVPNPMDYLR